MAKATNLLIGICIAAFLLQQVPWLSSPLLAYGAFSTSSAISMPWTWVTDIFLHADWVHLLVNMAALIVFGTLLEERIGPSKFAMAFIASGLIGNLGFMLSSPSPVTYTLGASGAIFGVIGALAYLAPNLVAPVLVVPMPVWLGAVFWAVIDLALSFYGSTGGISYFAHVAGLVFGLLAGWALKRDYSRHQKDRLKMLSYYKR